MPAHLTPPVQVQVQPLNKISTSCQLASASALHNFGGPGKRREEVIWAGPVKKVCCNFESQREGEQLSDDMVRTVVPYALDALTHHRVGSDLFL